MQSKGGGSNIWNTPHSELTNQADVLIRRHGNTELNLGGVIRGFTDIKPYNITLPL